MSTRLTEAQREAARRELPVARAALAKARAKVAGTELGRRPRRREVAMVNSRGDIVSVTTEELDAFRLGAHLEATGTDGPRGRLPYRDS